jgi:hypothetical protein
VARGVGWPSYLLRLPHDFRPASAAHQPLAAVPAKSPEGKVAWFRDPDGNVLGVSEKAG